MLAVSDRVLELRMSIPKHLLTRLLEPVIPFPLSSLFVLPVAVQDENRRKHERHTEHTNIDCVASRVFRSTQVSTSHRTHQTIEKWRGELTHP